MFDDLIVLLAFVCTVALGVAALLGNDEAAAWSALGLVICSAVRLARIVAQTFSPRY